MMQRKLNSSARLKQDHKIEFEKVIRIEPARDNPVTGISSMVIIFELHGTKGAVTFQAMTNTYLPKTIRRNKKKGVDITKIMDKTTEKFSGWMPMDLGYHSKTKQYDSQTIMNDCPLLDGADCYYDGSSLNAERPLKLLMTKGSDSVWRFLERYYRSVYKEKQ